MSVKLDDLDLITRKNDPDTSQVQEIRRVSSISIDGRRVFNSDSLSAVGPGILMDLGRRAKRILLEGEMHGPSAKESITALRSKFKTGNPLPISADIAGLADVDKVLIEKIEISQASGKPGHFAYVLDLIEYVEPPAEEEEPEPEDAEEEVKKESEIDDIKGRVVDADGEPMKDVKVKITGDDGEHEATTNSDGYYEVQDLPEGKYEITIDAKGFKNRKSVVEIRKGGEEEE